MNKIIEAQGILADARSCVECTYMAASGLGGGLKHEGTDPIQVVADTAAGLPAIDQRLVCGLGPLQ